MNSIPSEQVRAVFLDRDGVLMPDTNLLAEPRQLQLYSYAPQALADLHFAGFLTVVVTNQTVVARGLATEQMVVAIHDQIQRLSTAAGGGSVDRFYFCPHHPSATLPEYRVQCDCRKPRPGMLYRAATELGIDLASSWMVGDRLTDIAAGRRAGCQTILVETGMHLAPPIEVIAGDGGAVAPDCRCADLSGAVETILRDAS